jgi:hypothetical protein
MPRLEFFIHAAPERQAAEELRYRAFSLVMEAG